MVADLDSWLPDSVLTTRPNDDFLGVGLKDVLGSSSNQANGVGILFGGFQQRLCGGSDFLARTRWGSGILHRMALIMIGVAGIRAQHQ